MKYLLILVILIGLQIASANEYSFDTLNINSEILQEERTILLFTPLDLQHSDSVTLIYLPEGEYSEYRYKKILDEQFENPVVGIGIMNTDRRREMLPFKEAENFLKFISTELIPSIENDFIVCSTVLFGHSFGGCFTLYAMQNIPNLFDKYIASSPTPIMDMVDVSLFEEVDKSLDEEIKLYFSYGSKDMKQVRKWSEVLYNNIKDTDFEHLKWKHDIYQGENHNSCDIISLIKGIKI